MSCPEQLRRKLAGDKVPKRPILVAGGAIHDAAERGVWYGNYRRNPTRPFFFKSAESYRSWFCWIHWPQVVAQNEKPPGILWKNRKKELDSLRFYGAKLLTGLAVEERPDGKKEGMSHKRLFRGK